MQRHDAEFDRNRRTMLAAAIAAACGIAGPAFAREPLGAIAPAPNTAPDAAPPSSFARASFSHVDAALKTATESGELPGVVAMAATANGIVYEGAFGRRRLGDDAAMTPDTVFRIASMVKLITTVAAMRLVEQDRLALDTPVPPIEPDLATPFVLEGFDPAGKPQLRPAQRPITLRDLLTHTAGFSYRLWDGDVIRYLKAVEHLPPAQRSALAKTPLMFDPGTRWQYGPGIDRVGRIVEHVSGEPLDVHFRRHIFDPLGMADTTFVLEPQQYARAAGVHHRQHDGSLKAAPPDKPPAKPTAVNLAPRKFSGGAGIYSTATDYLTLLRALMHGGAYGGARLLRPETVALMGHNQIGGIEVGILRTTAPALSNDVDFFPGIPLRWGFGHMINMQPVPGGRGALSLTWAGLLNTYYWIDPAKGVAAVFMTQLLPFADHAALRSYRLFERGLYGALRV
jgi:CubicO group peptidase (beta-lactamase class C family)